MGTMLKTLKITVWHLHKQELVSEVLDSIIMPTGEQRVTKLYDFFSRRRIRIFSKELLAFG